MEIWKDIIGYENRYQVSNLGRIKSVKRYKRRFDKILKPLPLREGYLAIDLCYENKVKKILIHRLVASAFLENPENKPQVNHINGIKTDNRLENLEWVTNSENQLHSVRIGIRTTKGVNNSQTKLTEESVMNIFHDKRKYHEICRDFNVSIPTVCDIKRGYSWTHITGLPNLKKQIVA